MPVQAPPPRRARIARLAALIAGIAVASAACEGNPPPTALRPGTDPREVALAVFQAAQTGRNRPDDLKAVVRCGDSARDRAALADLLAHLAGTTQARIVGYQEIDADRAAVDLSVALPGGGRADYTVHTGKEEDASWRVTAILGPDASWPPAPTNGGEGLSTSSPPSGVPAR